MSSRERIPPLLEPYVQLPSQGSLHLVTGILNATPTWLVPRFLTRALGDERGGGVRRATGIDGDELQSGTSARAEGGENVKVVLVSWMRDWEFWRVESRRGKGPDLARLAAQNRFAFVDGLTQLFSGNMDEGKQSTTERPRPGMSSLPGTQSPRRTGPVTQRGPVPQIRPSPPLQSAPQQPSTKVENPNMHTLTSHDLDHATAKITSAISSLTSSDPEAKVLLILDAPTVLLATTSTPSSALSSFILNLRSQVHSTILLAEADSPFLAAAMPHSDSYSGDYYSSSSSSAGLGKAQHTPLETEHAAFVTGQAHAADLIIGTRALETGVAKDVSGVLRVSRGYAWEDDDDYEDGEDERRGRVSRVEPIEVLYRVMQDGNVKVFQRGAGDVG